MADCKEMKKGEIYYCKDCGIEFQIVKECNHTKECGCKEDESCIITCCGKPLVKK